MAHKDIVQIPAPTQEHLKLSKLVGLKEAHILIYLLLMEIKEDQTMVRPLQRQLQLLELVMDKAKH